MVGSGSTTDDVRFSGCREISVAVEGASCLSLVQCARLGAGVGVSLESPPVRSDLSKEGLEHVQSA